MSLKKRARWLVIKHVKFRWWSFRNWRKGYKYDCVQRFRCCDHTTPFHSWTCPERGI